MKSISDFMAAFEKIGELGDPSEANRILSAPEITLSGWLKKQREVQWDDVRETIPNNAGGYTKEC